jgi:hypothetical protein
MLNTLATHSRSLQAALGDTDVTDDTRNDGGVEMMPPRIGGNVDGRQIEERLGDLADALNEE